MTGSSHPYLTPNQVRQTIDRFEASGSHLVHPQEIIQQLRREKTGIQRFNGWLADHVVGLAGTMVFFYLLCVLIASWAFWQSAIAGGKGFDPFPYAFLFFVLGGIMQSLFVPTMLTASNRAAGCGRVTAERTPSGVGSTRTFQPRSTVSVHSVSGRTVVAGVRRRNASFCRPPESVITPAARSTALTSWG